MDFANARIQITRDITKTDAGVRTIPMVPALRAVLIAHSVERPYGPREHVFPTRNGTRNTPDNVRAHIIDTAHERADKLLGASGGVVIAHLTPHRSAARLHRSWRSSGCRRAVPCTSLAIPTRGSP
jgi:integrase